MAYVAATTGLSVAAVEHIINNPHNVVREDGEITHIIGRTLSEEELVILSIIGGTIVASGKVIRNGDCEDWVQFKNQETRDGNPDHTLGRNRKDGKSKYLDTVKQIKDIILDPKRIVDAAGTRYYIRMVDGKWVALVLGGGMVHWLLVTALDNNGAGYKNIDNLMDDIKDREKKVDTIYDPDQNIHDC